MWWHGYPARPHCFEYRWRHSRLSLSPRRWRRARPKEGSQRGYSGKHRPPYVPFPPWKPCSCSTENYFTGKLLKIVSRKAAPCLLVGGGARNRLYHNAVTYILTPFVKRAMSITTIANIRNINLITIKFRFNIEISIDTVRQSYIVSAKRNTQTIATERRRP